MNTPQEIERQLKLLPLSKQEDVLRYVTALTSDMSNDRAQTSIMAFAGTLDAESAREMREAIEEGCEQVDAGQWSRSS